MKRRKRIRLPRFYTVLMMLIMVVFGGKEYWPTWLEKIGLDSISRQMSYSYGQKFEFPQYGGTDYVVLNRNVPDFSKSEVKNIDGEEYSKLDYLGRCGPATAMLHRSMMPEEERGEIGEIKPSGWHTVKYPDVIPDRYLYNRCHLIAYAMTGQNANELNLITGTRYMNATVMLPFEVKILQYLERTGNHVLYRVTPRFKNRELVARGIELEAYSVEDQGQGICFHVYLFNRQPGIEIDYSTGESWIGSSV